jgi:hypothetical protein
MNATLFNGGKVHWLLDLAARCGVGKRRQRRAWQMELGAVTCLRCVKLKQADEKARKVLTTDERG